MISYEYLTFLFRLKFYWKPLEKHEQNGNDFSYILVQLQEVSKNAISNHRDDMGSEYHKSSELVNFINIRFPNFCQNSYSFMNIFDYITLSFPYFKELDISKQLTSTFGSIYHFKVIQLEQSAEYDLAISNNEVSTFKSIFMSIPYID